MASIRGQYLGGETVVSDGVATVGDVMLRVARDEHRFASDVVVLPVGSGEVLEHGRTPPPDVCVVLKKEEDELSAEECLTNITLHAEAEDTTTVTRALAMLEVVPRNTRKPGDMLLEAARDPTKEKTVRTLIRAGVNGNSALSSASKDGDAAAVQGLIDAGLKVDGRLCGFFKAARRGHTKVVQILIEARADANFVGGCGNSVLWVASFCGRTEMVQVLIEARADVNYISGDGYPSALLMASRFDRKKLVPVLIEARADVNYVNRNRNGESALRAASSRGSKEVVQVLIEARADVNYVDRNGESALWAASSRGSKEVVQVLIEARADMNADGEDGESALRAASSRGSKEMVQILLDAGARPL